jgi:predicted GNAT family acetyltransferase
MAMFSTDEVRISGADADSRYELFVGGKLAGKLVYRDEGDTRIFLHTEVEPAYRGGGLATRLIEWSLEDVRTSGKHLWVKCPTVSAYLARNPERHVG